MGPNYTPLSYVVFKPLVSVVSSLANPAFPLVPEGG